MSASRASARLAGATPAPMAGPDKNDKAALATKAAMLISGGKFADLKALRDGDTAGAFKDAADRTIRTRLTAIPRQPVALYCGRRAGGEGSSGCSSGGRQRARSHGYGR